MLRLTDRAVLDMIERGAIVGYKVAPKAWRISRASVEEHLQRNRQPPESKQLTES